MTNRELQKLLQEYPDDMKVKLLPNSKIPIRGYDKHDAVPLTEENIIESSEGAWVDDEADPETWDCEDGKIKHSGERYILFNPIIT